MVQVMVRVPCGDNIPRLVKPEVLHLYPSQLHTGLKTSVDDYVISHCQSLVSTHETQGGCTALWCVTRVSSVPCGVFYRESMLKTDRQQPWVPLQAQTITATTQRTFRPQHWSHLHLCFCVSMLSDICVCLYLPTRTPQTVP